MAIYSKQLGDITHCNDYIIENANITIRKFKFYKWYIIWYSGALYSTIPIPYYIFSYTRELANDQWSISFVKISIIL